MQTQSDRSLNDGPGEWVARTETPARSVYGNYVPALPGADDASSMPIAGETHSSLQDSIDTAVARSFAFRFLAALFQDPEMSSWAELRGAQSAALCEAADTLDLFEPAANLAGELERADFDEYRAAHYSVFGHAARGRCPLNEIEYGDVHADPLFQPHRLADLAAFYQAFGLALAPDADERQDHLSMELEFMSVLAAKEAFAIEHQLDSEDLAVCRDAERKFIREHLGRWVPAFARRFAAAAEHPLMSRLAEFTRLFMEAECARWNVKPGSQDMLLRAIDDAAETMCASCGLGQLPPGA